MAKVAIPIATMARMVDRLAATPAISGRNIALMPTKAITWPREPLLYIAVTQNPTKQSFRSELKFHNFLPQIEKQQLRGGIMRPGARGDQARSDLRERAHNMGLYVTHIREAILRRSRGFSPLGWCVGIVGGKGFVRRSLKVVSVPPLVGLEVVVLLWGCVWA